MPVSQFESVRTGNIHSCEQRPQSFTVLEFWNLFTWKMSLLRLVFCDMVQNKIINHNYSWFLKGHSKVPFVINYIYSHWNNLQHKEAIVKAKRKVGRKNNSIGFDIWIQEKRMRDTNRIFISKKTLGQMFWKSPERAHQILQKVLPPRNMSSC